MTDEERREDELTAMYGSFEPVCGMNYTHSSRRVADLEADLSTAKKEIEGLKKGNDALRALWKKNKNLHTKDGCICRFDEDGETVLEECGIHGSMRKEIKRLKASLRLYAEDCDWEELGVKLDA